MIIQAQNISKTFTLKRDNAASCARQNVLSAVSFSVETPQVVGLIGPNGAGKTTLLKILSSLILADSGNISLCGFRPDRGGREARQYKACLGLADGEERSFYWRLSGQRNLELFAALFGLNAKTAAQRIDGLFHDFHISNGGQRFDSYSTGTKRKFALARALLHKPKVVLLDEPTKSLDWTTAAGLRRVISSLPSAGQTVLLATHDLNEAQEICDRVLILCEGKLAAQGTLDELRQTAGADKASLADVYCKLTEKS